MHNRIINQNRSARFAGIPQRQRVIALAALLCGASALGIFAQEPSAIAKTANGKLKPGDIVYADSGNAIEGGFLIKVDPNTGEQTVISSGGNLIQPFDVAFDARGQIIVSDTGLCCTLIRVDPETGRQTVITDNSRGTLGVPFGIAVARDGDVLVANAQAIVRVDPVNGQAQTVSSGGCFRYPLGIAVAQNGDLFVANVAFPGEIVRVNPRNGAQTILSRGGYLKNPQAIAIQGDDIYVTDVATPDGNFGVGRVIHVDARTGTQTVVSESGYLVGPVGIAVDEGGQIIVGDPYTINPESLNLFDGGIIRIDPLTGVQTLIARGRGSFLNPRGLAVVPGLSHKQQDSK